ncbi:hypothetical protein D9758_013178 [Tetrapyrgos nigripes]|uniref:HET-domain-containing protein n=1 Tax=Tetrapyrgos nigripes TaxID=182062 RepID=A0A8H5FK41_9AGAR|nr:hypothetical protein D9758_013178 [Tetrapyrgos nigripes]
MRLLNTRTLRTAEFYAEIPPYAILSHTWGKEEVTFQDIQNLEAAKQKAGYAKIEKACAHALNYNFSWIWIDSCCINKESSAELSEAINSMYQYYEDSEVCYAYLCDASAGEDPRDIKSTFKDCKWFKRGWTLQELLAPRYLVFLDKDWIEIGTKWSLRDVVSVITAIPVPVLVDGDKNIDKYSIAQRMSWAAYRKTTRPEDRAYCLMGVFGVNMPPIYGEGGKKAFVRLQQEIIKISDDRSIFAWLASPEDSDEARGLLARSPYEFRMSGEVQSSDSEVLEKESSYSFGNNGLRLHVPLTPSNKRTKDGPLYLASLLCRSARDGSYLSVYLKEIRGGRYIRCRPDEIALTSSSRPYSLRDMHEVVVKEPRLLRRSRRRQLKESEVTGDLVFQLRLLPNAQNYLSFLHCQARSCDSFNPATQRATISSAEIRGRVGGVQTSLSYKTNAQEDSGADFFSIMLAGNHFEVTVRDLGPNALNDVYRRGDTQKHKSENDWHRMDRSIASLPKCRGVVSVASQLTNNRLERILEIDFLKPNDTGSISHPHRPVFLTRPLRPPELGFMVPSTIRMPYGSDSISLKNVFSSDFYGKECGGYTHVSMPDNSAFDVDDRSHTLRVLTYTYGSASWTVYVLLGFHHGISSSEAWTSIFFLPGIAEAEQVWKTYVFEDRARLGNPRNWAEASIDLESGSEFRIIARTEERSTLQLGSHLLRLEILEL